MSGSPKTRAVLLIALGALAGILLAPKSGRGTRHAIATEVDDGRKYVTYLWRNTREEAGHMVESSKRLAHKVTHL
jgi:gas vesicle protein